MLIAQGRRSQSDLDSHGRTGFLWGGCGKILVAYSNLVSNDYGVGFIPQLAEGHHLGMDSRSIPPWNPYQSFQFSIPL